MRRNRTVGHTHIWAEHLKLCIREAYPAENSNAPHKPTPRIRLLEIIQFMWENGSILTELGWTVLVLISKVNMNTWGIGMIEVAWKVEEALIDTRIKAVVQLHYVLHKFHARGVKGKAIMDLKLAQELASVDQYILLLVFLHLRKA